jgi:RsiW-degrading membrane proteinase PrsW (M82 family)
VAVDRAGGRRTRSFVAAGWLNIGLQVGILAALWAAGAASPADLPEPLGHLSLATIVAATSASWAAYFYLQDRRQAEPARYVVAAYLGGMGAAAAFAVPIERDLFRTSEWLFRSPGTLALGTVLIRGALMALLVHLVVRHWFYPAREFDEPVDGMVYGAMAGSGFATVTSLTYVVAAPDLTLFAVGYTAAVQILIYASIGAIVGYLTGRTKFGRGGPWSHVLAVVAGALLTGGYHALNDGVLRLGSARGLWLSFGATLLLSVVVMGSITLLMGRLAAGPRVAIADGTAGVMGARVWGVALMLLVAGGFVAHAETRTTTITSREAGLSIERPGARTDASGLAGTALGLSPLLAVALTVAGQDGGPYAITVATRAENADLATLDPLAYLGVPAPLTLGMEPVAVANRAGVRARYAYTTTRPDGGATALPEVIWAVADIVPSAGRTVVFALQATPEAFRRQEPIYQRMLGSVRWQTP